MWVASLAAVPGRLSHAGEFRSLSGDLWEGSRRERGAVGVVAHRGGGLSLALLWACSSLAHWHGCRHQWEGNGWGESVAGAGGTGGGVPFGVPPCRPPGARTKYIAPIDIQKRRKRIGS
jgi:hypothetical protein